MDLLKWAEKEVEYAKKGEHEYGCRCYDSALKAYKSLLEDNHSGLSIKFVKKILNDLIDGNNLTPIEESDDIWEYCFPISSNEDAGDCFQCIRKPSLFKDVYFDGRVSYRDVDIVSVREIGTNTVWHNGFISNLIHEMYPITLPYISNRHYKVTVEKFLTDKKNGDYDTIGVFNVLCIETGETKEINRYFKDSDDGFTEISKEEYMDRRAISYEYGGEKEVENGSNRIN